MAPAEEQLASLVPGEHLVGRALRLLGEARASTKWPNSRRRSRNSPAAELPWSTPRALYALAVHGTAEEAAPALARAYGIARTGGATGWFRSIAAQLDRAVGTPAARLSD